MDLTTSLCLFCFFVVNTALLIFAAVPRNKFGLPNKLFIFYLLFLGIFISIKYIESKLFFSQYIFLLNNLVLYCIGPMLFFFTKSVLIPDYKVTFKEKWHFLPALIVFIGIFSQNIRETSFVIEFSLASGVAFQGFCYDVVALIMLKKHDGKKVAGNSNLLRFTKNIHYFLMFQIVSSLTLAFIYGLEFKPYVSFFGILILIFFVYNSIFLKVAFSDLSSAVYKFLDSLTSKTSKNIDELEVYQNILEKVVKRKMFLDQELTIRKLSDEIKVHSSVISRVINKVEKRNFNAFINSFRIEEAKKLLSSKGCYKSYSIETIGEKSGFKSKSSFYDAFKKLENCTPSKYHKMMTQDFTTIKVSSRSSLESPILLNSLALRD